MNLDQKEFTGSVEPLATSGGMSPILITTNVLLNFVGGVSTFELFDSLLPSTGLDVMGDGVTGNGGNGVEASVKFGRFITPPSDGKMIDWSDENCPSDPRKRYLTR